MDETASFYSSPSYHYRGAGFPVFSGSRRQRGGSILGSLKNFFMPILKNFGRSVARKGTRAALQLANDVASDALSGRNIKESFINNAKSRAKSFGKEVVIEELDTLNKSVRGAGNSRKRRRYRSRSSTSRKRRYRSKSAFRQKNKRRRLNPKRRLKGKRRTKQRKPF